MGWLIHWTPRLFLVVASPGIVLPFHQPKISERNSGRWQWLVFKWIPVWNGFPQTAVFVMGIREPATEANFVKVLQMLTNLRLPFLFAWNRKFASTLKSFKKFVRARRKTSRSSKLKLQLKHCMPCGGACIPCPRPSHTSSLFSGTGTIAGCHGLTHLWNAGRLSPELVSEWPPGSFHRLGIRNLCCSCFQGQLETRDYFSLWEGTAILALFHLTQIQSGIVVYPSFLKLSNKGIWKNKG